MNKLIAAMILLFFLIHAVQAAAIEENRDTIFRSEELRLGIELSSAFSLKAESSDYSVGYVRVNLTLFPKQDAYQQVQITGSRPRAVESDGNLLFEWQNPEIGLLSFDAAADVLSRREFVPVTEKARFPVGELDEGLRIFTEPSENVDSDNQQIVTLASSLAAGEDDLFEVVYKLAEWSNQNIKYNLSTLTADVSKPASWVLENRQGVCDEFTNLFIALNRALGIPARFVSGIAYTDSELFPEHWGFHGWAEVYFPGYGWVPFDVTYGEFGFVDAGHIKLSDGIDVSETTTNYQWSGRNISIETNQLKQSITLKDAYGNIEPDASITSKALKDVVGFGSYNIEEVEVTNLKDHYVIAELVHSNTESLQLIGSNKRDILLKPGQKRHEYFVFRVNESLNGNFIYTFPLNIVANLVSAESEFSANSEARVFSIEEVNSLRLDEAEEKIYSRNINLECSADKSEIYLYESTGISCTVKNTGNVALNNLYFCHEENCQLFSLGITRSREFNFTARFTAPGINRAKVLVDSDTVSKAAAVEVNVLDEPSIVFSNITHPGTVSYNEIYSISFLAARASNSIPLEAEITIKPTKAIFSFPKIENRQKVTAELSSLDLNDGKNTLTIEARFKDKNGKAYSEEKQITIEVKKLNFLQKIKRLFLRLFR